MNLRDFDIREADWKVDANLLSNVRHLVFVIEQSVPENEEWDDRDEDCSHWLATNFKDLPVGTCRLLPDGQIGRMAVLPNWRGRGIGAALLEAAVQKARYLGFSNIYLNAQTHATGFYERFGFEKEGDEFIEAGIAHYQMMQGLISPEKENQDKAPKSIPSASRTNGARYTLGIDKQQILLRGANDFRAILLDMAAQAKRSICIYSPTLCHELFDNDSLSSIASTLARLNKYTRVNVLIFNPHRIIKHGHGILNLSRKLPSSVNIRIAHPEIRQVNQEFVLIDKQGFVYRQDHEKFEGSANFMDIAENNRLTRLFSEAWESGIFDPNLRRLQI